MQLVKWIKSFCVSLSISSDVTIEVNIINEPITCLLILWLIINLALELEELIVSKVELLRILLNPHVGNSYVLLGSNHLMK